MRVISTTTSVRASGIAGPAFPKSRPRDLLVAAPTPKIAAVPHVPIIIDELRKAGARSGEGVPFAAIYMTRSAKKAYALQFAA